MSYSTWTRRSPRASKMVMVRSQLYSLDAGEMARVAIRANYIQAWWYSGLMVIGGALLVSLPGAKANDFIGGAIILAGLTFPALHSLQTVSDVRRSPLFRRVIAVEFDENELRQLDESGATLTRVRYSELLTTDVQPRGPSVVRYQAELLVRAKKSLCHGRRIQGDHRHSGKPRRDCHEGMTAPKATPQSAGF